MDKEIKPGQGLPPADSASAPQSDQSVDEFFNRLQSEMRRPDVSQEAVAAAFQAIQSLAMDSDVEEAVNVTAPVASLPAGVCPVCHAANPAAGRFCSVCGAPLRTAQGEVHAPGKVPAATSAAHQYHHHYHHHYFAAGSGALPASAPDAQSVAAPAARVDAVRRPAPVPGAPMSRSEIAVRKVSQNWAQACNTKHLDDLVGLYSNDALLLRANFPPVRGSAAIREFFFAALDAGLGEAEMDPVRVEVFGDIAYEAGRCKTLVPTPAGKRREERGKYLMVLVREPGGDWKTVVDCWSSDLSLGEARPRPA